MNKQSTWKIWFSMVVLVMGIIVIFPYQIAADENASFTISVKPVENQIDKKVTYYDLLVKPSMKQELTVIVSNSGEKAKKIKVTPTNAVTNQNGLIDYSAQEKGYTYDKTLKHPFTDLVGEAQTIDVQPNEQKEVTFVLEMPSEEFNGIVLGSFVAEVVDEKTDNKASKGVNIVNKFQLVKAVRLRENQNQTSPELKLNDVKPVLVSYRTAVTANLQNIEPVMFGQMTVDAKITKKGQTEIIKSREAKNLEMAPNSNFDFPISWENDPLDPGTYTLTLVSNSGKKEWKFTKDFTIENTESKKLNKEAVELNVKSTPWILYLLIVVVILLLVIIILLIVKKKKDSQDKLA